MMSLFPAYTSENVHQNSNNRDLDDNESKPPTADLTKPAWLDNASFSLNVSEIPLPSKGSLSVETETVNESTSCGKSIESESEKTSKVDHVDLLKLDESSVVHKRKRHTELPEVEQHEHKKHKKAKKKHKRKKRCTVSPEDENNIYIDTKRVVGNLNVSKLVRPIAPMYRATKYVLGRSHLPRHIITTKKKRSKGRYFSEFWRKDAFQVGDILEESQEGKLSKQTETYNRTLGDEPHNVDLWLQYVNFQDTVWQFERMYRRGDGLQGKRVTAERKLAIIDKALTYNPGCESLLLAWGSVAEAIYPADELSQHLSSQLEKHPKSMALWRYHISTTQSTLSLCSVTKVTELYGKAMMCFHQARRGAPASETRPAEINILDLLLQCGHFLRQAGLYEQLWTLLRHCLELNLTMPRPDCFKLCSALPEEKVIELEETVLDSNLPLPELWLRVERIRESAHWLPWESDDDCEDPQRLVFAEDVSDLLHPITTPDLGFQLAANVMTLLKVPLLPCRHTALQSMGVLQLPWAFDSVEMLLTAVLSFGTVDCGIVDLLTQIVDLVTGPSFLSFTGHHVNLGQEHYLDFVIKVFHACGDCLKEPSRTAWFVWWLRFERFLIAVMKHNLCNLPAGRKKKLKSSIKDFLKREENRNNLLYYKEYALIEKEFGNFDSACSILRTAVSSNQCDKTQLCSLYRTLCEILLTASEPVVDKHKRAIELLVTLPLGVFQPTVKLPPLDRDAAIVRFQHITDELVNDPAMVGDVPTDGSEHLWPDLLVDWITCHAWLLYLTKSTWVAGALLEDTLTKILVPPSSTSHQRTVSKTSCQREALFESYISILHQHCQETYGNFSVLNAVVQRALQEFPYNIHFLASALRIENRESYPWWKLKRLFNDTDSQLSKVFLVLWTKHQQTQELQAVNELKGSVIGTSYKNRLNSLFGQLINDSSRHCPIIWRLYLKFLFQFGNHEGGKSAFYRAVEVCPWVKELYVEGVKTLPADIQQIQDLIIEKELRLHVTPEELDILRSNT